MMKQYIEISDFRRYLEKLEQEGRSSFRAATMLPIGDIQEAHYLCEAFARREAEEELIDELALWAAGAAVPGYLILPTMKDGIFVRPEKAVDTLGKGN